jgi:hypothetical protein
MLQHRGAEFDLHDYTPRINQAGSVRGNEIYLWLTENKKYKHNRYIILDDDSDMLLWQQEHFFKTDGYVGLTPGVCYRAKRFLEKLK